MPSASRYDAIVVGGGHNGLVNAAYLARAGRRVLVLERRPRVGGAAVTEEVFPGFKFSMFSYVVSLLRPEIIRDLDLPGHGLHILPLESTLTPMENGDYLAAWADHDETRRELYRHSPRDADAYDEYGRLMHFMAHAVKPILGMVPPDPTSLHPRDLAGLLRRCGAEVGTDGSVARVRVTRGRATGVVLENGDEIRAKAVVSSLDPRRTFLQLLESDGLPGDFVEAIRRFKFRGSSGKVNLALGALPNFTCMPGPGRHLRGAVSISPSLEYVERAYDDAKYGEFSRRPYLDIVIPSMIDPGMAPPGKHVMSVFVQYAPYHLNGGWTPTRREAFGDAVVKTLARYAPNIESLILHRQVLTPDDIERITGLSEGNIFQGELALQQLFFLRPAPSWARYRTPVRGLYQCGAGTHPGGGIMGASGRLAALAMLGDGA